MTISVSSFTAGTTIQSAAVNANFTAIVNALAGITANAFTFLSPSNASPSITCFLPTAPSGDTPIYVGEIAGDTGTRIDMYMRSDGYGGIRVGSNSVATGHLYGYSGGWVIPETLQITQGNPIISSNSSDDQIGFGLNGGANEYGISTKNTGKNMNVIASSAVVFRYNHYFDGANDVFIRAAGAYQVTLDGSGFRARKSTNGSPTAGATITWGGFTNIFT